MFKLYVFLGFAAIGVVSCSCQSDQTDKKELASEALVLQTYPHQKTHYTQGLEVYRGIVYEGTGGYGYDPKYPESSSLNRIELKSGKVLQKISLSDELFGEGITILDDKLYQLTWKSGRVFRYALEMSGNISSQAEAEFEISGEGWGLTNDGQSLIYSDGSSLIRYLNPDDMSIEKTVKVTLDGVSLTRLNELEFVDGYIYANVYGSTKIYKIGVDGKVVDQVELKELVEYPHDLDRVLNGIAVHPDTNNLLVTGKWWDKIYEISWK